MNLKKLLALAIFALAPLCAVADTSAPSFSVKGFDGKTYDNKSLAGKTVVLEWFNPGCPFVQRAYDEKYMQGLQEEFTKKGVVWLTVNSTKKDHSDYVESSKIPDLVSDWGMKPTTLVNDETGELGHKFGAKTTPHMFVIDKEGKLAYAGALDNHPQIKGDSSQLQEYTKSALTELLSGKNVSVASTKAYGCSIKYAS